MKPVTWIVVLSILAASFAANALTQAASGTPTIANMPVVYEIKVEQDPASVAAKLNAALNAHDANAALALFTDDAVVKILPEDVLGGVIANGKEQVRVWLQGVVLDDIRVQALSSFQVLGNNVTWTESFFIYQYEDIGGGAESGVVGTAEAVVQEDKIRSFTLVFSPESVTKLRSAPLSSTPHRQGLSSMTYGFQAGLVALGLIFPAAAVYYISRVRSLFAAVPRLERPWLFLLAGVAALFLATFLILLRGFATIPSWDAVYSVVLVVAAFFILASMVFMKRVWTIGGSE